MSKMIEDLDPDVAAKCRTFLVAAFSHGFHIKITHTLRTWDEQQHIFAKGREIPGEPCNHGGRLRAVGECDVHPLGATVSNARPGFSWHNWGRAFDVAFQGSNPYPDDNALWRTLGKIGQTAGLEWREADRPHFQDRGPKTLAELRQEYRERENLA